MKIFYQSLFFFQLYPNGAWFLYFKGRLEFMRGNVDDAIKWYTVSVESQDSWPQFHHLCFWELCWANWYIHNIFDNFECSL